MSRKNRIDDLMEAVTFAEVGEMETARGIALRVFPDEGAWHGERILAVSRAPGFSRRMIEQAVAMAERLRFGVVGLTAEPAFERMFARLRGPRAARGRLPPDAFRAAATGRGIPFDLAVGRGDPERVVAEVRRGFRRIAFLLVEPSRAREAHLTRVDLPVFYLDEG